MTVEIHRIRPAEPDDIDQLISLETRGSNRWNREFFLQEMENSFSEILVTTDNNEVLAYLVYWRVHDELQIQNISVAPSFRRRQLAKNLLDEALRRERPQLLTLEVREDNIPAQDLYRKYGFSVVGRRPLYYGDCDAILMNMEINDAINNQR